MEDFIISVLRCVDVYLDLLNKGKRLRRSGNARRRGKNSDWATQQTLESEQV